MPDDLTPDEQHLVDVVDHFLARFAEHQGVTVEELVALFAAGERAILIDRHGPKLIVPGGKRPAQSVN